MSEPLRIALVAEGPTDYEVIKAALAAVLPQPFLMTPLQPEPTQPKLGNGWGGVLKWCHAASRRHTGPLSQEPTLSQFDLVILHLDADVATMSYRDCGDAIVALAQTHSWGELPCNRPCPPASDTCAALEQVMQSWLHPATADAGAIRCIPAQSTGAWLACAVLDTDHTLLQGAECNINLEKSLAQLPKTQRIKKNAPEYRKHASQITSRWGQVKALCAQAVAFELAVRERLVALGMRGGGA